MFCETKNAEEKRKERITGYSTGLFEKQKRLRRNFEHGGR